MWANGAECFDIRFELRDGATAFEVLKGDRERVLHRPMTEWSESLLHPPAKST